MRHCAPGLDPGVCFPCSHGLSASLNWRFAQGLQFQINYTFSKTIDGAIDFNTEFMPFRPTRVNLKRSLSTFDIRHNFVAHAVFQTRFKAEGGFLSHAVSNMTIAPVLFLRSGIPFTLQIDHRRSMAAMEISFSPAARGWFESHAAELAMRLNYSDVYNFGDIVVRLGSWD